MQLDQDGRCLKGVVNNGKNQFLIYNDLINHLYDCTTIEELKTEFMLC